MIEVAKIRPPRTGRPGMVLVFTVLKDVEDEYNRDYEKDGDEDV